MFQKDKKNHGTALNELFGCPILKLYSRREIMKIFYKFKNIKINCYQPGFSRLRDFSRFFKSSFMNRVLVWMDKTMADRWGFYWIVECCK